MQRDWYFYRQSNDDSNYLLLEITVRTIHVENTGSTHSSLQKVFSHSLNLDSHWNSWEQDNRRDNQEDHKLKTKKNKYQNFNNLESSNSNLDDQKWNSHSHERNLNQKIKNKFHWKNHLSINQAVNEKRVEKIQDNVSLEEFDHYSNQNRKNWI